MKSSWTSTRPTNALKIKYPIVQAPLAGHTNANSVATISNAGGLGSLGCGMMPVDAVRQAIRDIKAKTNNPFAINVFCRPNPPTQSDMLRATSTDSCLNAIRHDLALPIPQQYPMLAPSTDKQLEVILEEKVPVLSYTFGYLSDDILSKLWASGTYVIGTATTVAEAVWLAGLDTRDPRHRANAIVAQGIEAGGHRGTFLDLGADQLPTRELVHAIRAEFKKHQCNVTLLAAGGISNGTEAAEMLKLTDGVVIGSMFMLTSDWPTPSAHKNAMMDDSKLTKVTRAISGRKGRAIVNTLMKRLESETNIDEVPSYDIQGVKIKDITAHAIQQDDPEYMYLLSGARAKDAAHYTQKAQISSAQLLEKLVKDIGDHLAKDEAK